MHDDTSGEALDCRGVWAGNDRPAVTPFGYYRDGLFLAACALYALNRWMIRPHVPIAYFKDHFNDVLLIPCALPLALLVQRWLKVRRQDGPPTLAELILHLLVWSCVCEWLGPHLFSRATGDPWDVVSYWAGGVVAWLWWQRGRVRRRFAHYGF